MDFMFTLVPLLMAAIVAWAIYSWIKERAYNKSQPRITVAAKLVTKRTSVSGGSHTGDHHSGASTWYYATFEFSSGDRKEFSVDGNEYGMLAEGDKGELLFQGNEFISFTRTMLS